MAYDSQDTGRRRRADHIADDRHMEPSMNAPQPLPGRQRRVQPPVDAPLKQPAPADQPMPPYAWQQGYPQQPNYSPTQENAPVSQPTRPQPPLPPQGYEQGWQGGYQPPQSVYPQPGYGQGQMAPQKPAGSGVVIDFKMLGIAAAAVVAVIVLISMLVGSTRTASQHNDVQKYVRAYEDRYAPGVYVDGIHLGGMTREEAQQTVQSQAQQRFNQWYIRLETKDDHGQKQLVGTINAAMLGMTVDVTNALDAAWQPGHTGDTVQQRKAEMDALQAENFHVATAQPSGSASSVDAFLNMLAQQAYLAPQDATVAFDPAATNPFIITDGVNGRMLDTAPIKAQIETMLNSMQSGTIEITTTPIAPGVTRASLEDKYRLRGTAYTLISTTSTENRDNNILRACQLMNGTVIAPGEMFSFNGVVGKRTQANGFYKAIEYAYGTEREGYGGGVCQASSTVYIAAVRAGLEIVKREQHSREVNYTEYGLDATVNYDGKVIDFVFRNNTSSNIYVIAKVQRDPKIDRSHKIVRVDIYGEALPAGLTYDLVAAVTEVLPAPIDPVIVVDKKAQHAMYIDEEVEVQKAKDGCVVQSWRVVYQNGEEIGRDFMYTDTYDAKAQELWVGVSERPIE